MIQAGIQGIQPVELSLTLCECQAIALSLKDVVYQAFVAICGRLKSGKGFAGSQPEQCQINGKVSHNLPERDPTQEQTPSDLMQICKGGLANH